MTHLSISFVVMNRNTRSAKQKLLEHFPLMEPPITLSSEVAPRFSADNKALPGDLIAEYFSIWDQLDEFTEIIPCLRLKTEYKDIACLIYLKIALMSYEYILVSLDKDLNLLSKKVIAGTLSNNLTVKESVAYIDKDLIVHSMSGESEPNLRDYKPENSSSFQFEILPNGSIDTTHEENSTWEEENMGKRKN